MGSAISSFLTPPGTNARQGWENGQQQAGNYLKNNFAGASDTAHMLNAWNQSQIPHEQQNANMIGQFTTQGGRNAQTDAYGNYARGVANSEMGQNNERFAGNPSLAQGANLGALNSANQGTFNYGGYINSTPGMEQANNAYHQAVGQVGYNPGLNAAYGNLDSLIGRYQGVQAPAVGKGFLDYASELAGPAISYFTRPKGGRMVAGNG
jgi:hypothetical protein